MKLAAKLLTVLRATRASRSAPAAPAAMPAPLLLALEPRVVYDASATAIGAVSLQHHVDAHPSADAAAAGKAVATALGPDATKAVPQTGIQGGTQQVDAYPSSRGGVASRNVPGSVSGGQKVDGYSNVPQASTSSVQQVDSQREVAHDVPSAGGAGQQVVFIDPNVADYQTLTAGLPAGTRYVVLDGNSDGLAQIAQYLAGHPGVESIHLISHGAEGQVQAGSVVLNLGDLSAYRGELAQIGAEMDRGGNFLIYGCDVAAGGDGQTLVQQIASLTRLNVAAATHDVGAADLGGNWALDYDVGNVSAPVIVSASAELGYDHLLSQTVEEFNNSAADTVLFNDNLSHNNTPVLTSQLNLDGITYTFNQATYVDIDTDSFLQALPTETSADLALLINEGGPNGTGNANVSSVTITMTDGHPFSMSSFDIDVLADAGTVSVVGRNSGGGVVGQINIPSDGTNAITQTVNLGAAGTDVTSLTITGPNMTPTLAHLIYTELNPPVVTTTGSVASYEAGAPGVTVDSGITLTDAGAATQTSATVSVGSGFHTGDTLAFSSGSQFGDISASYTAATGILTLTSAGSSTNAQWQSALDSVRFSSTSGVTGSRTLSFQTYDGISYSSSATDTVNVTAGPVVTTTGGATTYGAGASPTAVDSGLSVTDASKGTETSATVSISGGFHSGDALDFTNQNGITGSYNAATGVLTLSGSASTANWASALDSVSFESSSGVLGSRTVSFSLNDGSVTSATASKTVDVVNPLQVTTDAGSAAFVAGDNATSTPVAVDSGLTLTDSATSTLASATVAITSGFVSAEDRLAFANNGSTMGDIAGSYSSATGVLTLTSAGGATLAQWRSALDSVTYTDTAVTPNNATRTVSFTATDSLGNTSATATRTVTVTDTDQTPIVATTGGTTSYVGASSGVTIDGNVRVTDGDNSTQTSATVAVTTGFQSGDVLSFTNDGVTMGNIQASYSAGSGVLLLTSIGGSATNAQWASALSSVTFSSTSTTYGNRTIWYQVNDGTKNSAQAADTINMTAPPAITTDSGSAAFVAGDNATSTPVAVDSGLTVTDGSAATLASTTVAITGGFQIGEDRLAFTNNGSTMGNIAASYNATTGVMTLTSSGNSATLAQWQSALRSVTYTDTVVTPNNATRTISFTAVDGAGNTSATATRTVTVTDTDQTPVVRTTHGTTNYVGGTSAATIDGGISVTDGDNTTQSSGTVSITSGFHSGDVLTFVNSNSTTFGNIVGSYNSTTGVLTLTSSGAVATDAQWSNALSAVTFSAGASATPGNRTISFATSDGMKTSTASSDTVDVLGPPTIATDPGSAAFVAGDNTASTPVAVDSGLTLTDGVSPTLASATVAITGNFQSGEDVLAFANTNPSTFGNIAASYNASTGVLTLNSSGATASLAQWQAAFDAVTYTDTAVTPNNATRTISFSATDTGAYTSNTATRTVTVADTDQTPIVSTTHGTTNYVGGTSAAIVDGHVTVSDLDNTTQAFGTVSITTGFRSGDTLTFINTDSATFGNIVASYNASTGVLTLTSSGDTSSNLQWSNALSAVKFSASSSAPPGNRTLSFSVNDGTKDSAAATHTVDVLGPPTMTTDSGSAAFVAGDNTTSTPVTIDSGLTLTDSAAPTLASATVSITGNFHSGEDVLAFANTNSATFGNIASSYNAATGVLTLTSSGAAANLAQWQAALDAVTYTDTAVTPNNATRTISFTAIDTSAVTSNTATRTVTVADTDQTPIVSTTAGTASYTAGSAPTIVNPHVSVTDLDNGTQSSGTVSITGNFHSGDTLSFTNTNASTFGNIAASYNAATGVLTLTSTGATATDAQWSSALSAVTFSSSNASFGNRAISFATNDGAKTSAAAGATVAFFDRPQVSTDAGAASFSAADNATSTPVVVSPGLTLTDASVSAGNTSFASATVAITGGFHAGQDVLAFANDGTTMGNIQAAYDASTGVLTLTSAGGTASLDAWRSALASVTYTDTAVVPDNATRTIGFTVTDGNGSASVVSARSVTVTDTDQTPTLSVSGGATFTSQVIGSTPVAVAPQAIVGDRDPSATLTSAQVAIGSGFDAAHDTLALANGPATAGFGASYNAASGVLTLTWTGSGKPTLAQWQTALESVTYSNSAFRAIGSRTVAFTITDGVKTSVAASNTISIVTGPAGGTPSAAMPATPAPTTDTSTSTSSFSHSTGSDNTGAPDVLDELGRTQPIGSVPVVPTMTFSDPSAPAGSYSVDRATVSRFDATALDATLAVSQSSEMPTAASEMDVPVPEHDPFSIEVATLLPPSQALQGGASDVTVRLADGRSLPGWLHYDAASGVLRGKVPAGVQDVRIVVEAHDASGHVSRRDVVLAPHARGNGHGVAHPNHVQPHPHADSNGHANGHAALDLAQPLASRAVHPVGKPSLDRQFAQARAALHVVPIAHGAQAAHVARTVRRA